MPLGIKSRRNKVDMIKAQALIYLYFDRMCRSSRLDLYRQGFKRSLHAVDKGCCSLTRLFNSGENSLNVFTEIKQLKAPRKNVPTC